jgi:hypothetical protein
MRRVGLEGETATAIRKKLKDLLKEYELDISNMIAIGTDGASNMTGEHNGLVAQLKELDGLGWLVGVHCACHKIHLAAKESTNFTQKEKLAGVDKMLQPMNEIRKTLNETAHFIRQSPKQSRIFESMQKTKHKHKLSAPPPTRWASAALTADSVLRNRRPIIATLQRAKAEKGIKAERRKKIERLLEKLSANEFVIKAAVYTEVNKAVSCFIRKVCVYVNRRMSI